MPSTSTFAELNREDFDRALEARLCVGRVSWRILVPNVSVELQVRDRLRDKPVVQFLRLVDFLPVRIPARVEMPDPLEVVADVAHDIAVHDLRVIDVVENL